MQEAEAVLQQAEALAPMPGAMSMRASVAGRVGDADTALEMYKSLAKEEGIGSSYASSAAMSALYSDKLSAQQVAQLHQSLFTSWGHGARQQDTFVRQDLAGRRVRLGLVTADFHHQHPVHVGQLPTHARLNCHWPPSGLLKSLVGTGPDAGSFAGVDQTGSPSPHPTRVWAFFMGNP
jgi:threonine synthase